MKFFGSIVHKFCWLIFVSRYFNIYIYQIKFVNIVQYICIIYKHYGKAVCPSILSFLDLVLQYMYPFSKLKRTWKCKESYTGIGL